VVFSFVEGAEGKPKKSDHVLILFAHGSPDARWREPFERLHGRLSSRLGPNGIFLAYMEFCRPTLMEVVKTLRGRGMRNVRLLPLFMSAGGHVSADIPRQVREARAIYRDVDIEILPPLGEHPLFIRTAADIALEAFSHPPPSATITKQSTSRPAGIQTGGPARHTHLRPRPAPPRQ
jgi:sirohydrochlorin cobaltochelatase